MKDTNNTIAASEALAVTKPRHLTLAVWVGIALFALLLYGMTSFKLNDTVAATGYLGSDAGLSRMYARASGEVIKMAVREGDVVKKGQLLYVIGTSQSSIQNPDVQQSMLAQLHKKKKLLQRKLTVLQAQRAVVKKSYADQARRLGSKISVLKKQKKAMARERNKLKKLYSVEQSLASRHIITAIQLTSSLMNYYSALSSALQTDVRIATLSDQQEQGLYNLKIKESDLQASILDAKSALSDVSQQISRVGASSTEAVRSPVRGTVGYLGPHVGQSVKSGRLMATVIPGAGGFVARVFLPSSAMGKVHIGERVKIRYSSYPYMQYGLFKGQVSSIALTPASGAGSGRSKSRDGYAVTVRLATQHPKRHGIRLRLLPGATLNATIIVGHASLLRMLLAPALGLRSALSS